MIMDEIWKEIDGFDGYYLVSNLGRIKSTGSRARIRKPQPNIVWGYHYVVLKGKKGRRIHRLVAQAFLPNPNNYKEVNHINGDKSDNRVENLEWCTSSQNSKHAWDIGLKNPVYHLCKLTAEQVLEIRYLKYIGVDLKCLSKEFGVHRNTIAQIVNMRSWTHV